MLRALEQSANVGIAQDLDVGLVLEPILGAIDRGAGIDQEDQPVDQGGGRRPRGDRERKREESDPEQSDDPVPRALRHGLSTAPLPARSCDRDAGDVARQTRYLIRGETQARAPRQRMTDLP